MNVLFIDDTPSRALWLPEGCEYRLAMGLDYISHYLKHWHIDLVCLDHDMGSQINGMEVINLFRYDLAVYPILVVSQNPGASYKMVKEMEELTTIRALPFLADDNWTEGVRNFIKEAVR